MKTKIYIYGLCNIFYDAYYIQGLNEVYKNFEFNVSKFPAFSQGTFAVIIEEGNQSKKIIIDSRDSSEISTPELEWCDVYGKINYNSKDLPVTYEKKIVRIGPSFGVRIWNLIETLYFLTLNFVKFRKNIKNKKEFIANYWRQYKRLELKKYQYVKSSLNEIFFMNSIWKKENETNENRALFIETCKKKSNLIFEGGFAARTNGDNLGFDKLVYSKKIPLNIYIEKIKNSAFVFNTPAVLSCHGWKLGEFLALGKAIITTHHYNELPADLENEKHVLYIRNEDELQKSIKKLMHDPTFKHSLELESRDYFEKYLAPQKVILRLLERS
ncbi:hypothetical protein [Flavobacterium nitrogenifigens]|uniref:Glycosyl transferases group 1 n=3 Tax=Flavobacterium nitrogenifigens TaxID=1617283 RepID=A0A521EED4_9FLAO|nr:hypothetical protein [Flavobacterium nitrogenifigens]KAF2325964.1 hypothetical protein DM397_22165 [Flavobacterium nitrogenifigens]SMO82212.1 hypothetical protein SAMN06265220_104170 [Flavobacterium nitrogenifigens]